MSNTFDDTFIFTPPTHSGVGFVTEHHDTYADIKPTQWKLSGKVVLVTGASRGIGRATALSFAQAGASGIIIMARTSKALEEVEAALSTSVSAGQPTPKVLRVVCDVTDVQSVASAAKTVQSTFGRLDILVNNAGALGKLEAIVDSDPDDWWNTWVVNMRGPYLVSRAFLPLMMESDGGSKTIINVASVGAHHWIGGASSYPITKLALLRFTELLIAEHGKSGLIAIAIHPGIILTDMGKTLPEALHKFHVDSPELAGDFVVWLSKEGRDWLSGRYVSCNWDVNELEAKKSEILEGDKLKVRMVI